MAEKSRSICCTKSESVSLSTGVCSTDATYDEVNCDQAEEIREQIQKTWVGQPCIRPVQVQTEGCYETFVSPLGLKKVSITSENKELSMVVRLTAYSDRVNNIESAFNHELTTPYPLSLFKDGFMKKPDKPSLIKSLLPDSCRLNDSRRALFIPIQSYSSRWRCSTIQGPVEKKFEI